MNRGIVMYVEGSGERKEAEAGVKWWEGEGTCGALLALSSLVRSAPWLRSDVAGERWQQVGRRAWYLVWGTARVSPVLFEGPEGPRHA